MFHLTNFEQFLAFNIVLACAAFVVLMISKSYAILQAVPVEVPQKTAVQEPVKPVPQPATKTEFSRNDANPFRAEDVLVGDQRATLLLHHQPQAKKCRAQMILWSGTGAHRTQNGLVDLGSMEAEEIGDQLIADAINLAATRLNGVSSEVVKPARKRKRRKAAASKPVQHELPMSAPEVVVQAKEVVEQPKTEVPVKPKRALPPPVRGKILMFGMMSRKLTDKVIDQFGVKCFTADGNEEIVYGCNLEQGLHEANAGVGDTVEILKIGRRSIEEGKAPMNLFKVTKI